jgi:HEAT repeat protein
MRHCAILLTIALCVTAAPQDDYKQKIKSIKDYSRQGSSGIPSITGYLQDQDVDVRREAVKAIATTGGLDSLDPLVSACRDNDSEVQELAVDGIVNFYVPGYLDKGWMNSVKRAGSAVTNLFGGSNDQVVDPDTPVRASVIDAVIRVLNGGSSVNARISAARAAGILRARKAVPALGSALKSQEDSLMLESLLAMQKIRDPAAGTYAIFLVRDLDEKVQLAAIDVVGMLRTADAVPDLKRVVENGGKRPRRSALSALGQIGDPTLRPLFLQYLNDKDDGLRSAAAEGLARTGTAEDRPALQRMFETEKRAGQRLSYAFALCGLGDIDLATDGPLRYLSSNLTSRSYKGVALPFLAELAQKPEVRNVIFQMLKDLGDKDELSGLADVLAISGAKDSLPPLEELSRNPDPTVSRQALRAIRLINSRT